MSRMHDRKSNRLAGYDYSQPGCYFVTFCVVDRLPLLREGPSLRTGAQCAPTCVFPPLTPAGQAVEQAILGISAHYENVAVEKYVVMPNHVHLLLCIHRPESNGRTLCAPTKKTSVPQMIKMLKEIVTKRIGYSIWQKGYHDHIIRNDADYRRVWDYIDINPARWREDCYYTGTEE